jgi:hypothetical protein
LHQFCHMQLVATCRQLSLNLMLKV